ncbi:MAG: DUF2961 domain-containing protein [Candidatus Omnitrophica bacterium]|nr:DUF2961 domain-containing protein [Candidatus Omnitrophota bacterium]
MGLCRVVGLAFFLFTLFSVAAESDLATLSRIESMRSLRASSYDRTGGNTDNVISFAPGEVHTMLETEGPGRINHLWLTLANFPYHHTVLRDLAILIYWEGSDVPSVEVPLGDFFCQGHQMFYPMESNPVTVGINPRAFNCYWPMPFHKHAKIQIKNIGERGIRRIYYNIDYELGEIDDSEGLFHALFRREPRRKGQPLEHNQHGENNYVVLDTQGRGQYVGTFMAIDSKPGGWWGEGDEMIFIDGEEKPSIVGTGTEDYFGNAWGFTHAFSYPFYGAPFLRNVSNGNKQTCMYRWHIADPIRFQKSIRVTLETTFDAEIENDFSSLAYWYQDHPIEQRPELPTGEDLNAPLYDMPEREADRNVDGTEFEIQLRRKGVSCRSVTSDHGHGIRSGGWLRVESDNPFEIEIPTATEGRYEVDYRPVIHAASESYRVSVVGGDSIEVPTSGIDQRELKNIPMGEVDVKDRTIRVHFEVHGPVGIDQFHIRPLN